MPVCHIGFLFLSFSVSSLPFLCLPQFDFPFAPYPRSIPPCPGSRKTISRFLLFRFHCKQSTTETSNT
uniref:Putative secreted protein n=1 Tax=Anopheles darlingi TaxID=43151 RepID=A0A2M4DLH6_ANODA